MGQMQVRRGKTPREHKEEIAIYKSRRRSLEQHPLHKPPRKPTLLTPWFRASSLQNCSADLSQPICESVCWSWSPNWVRTENCHIPGWPAGHWSPAQPRMECVNSRISLMQLPHVGEWCCRSAQLNMLFNTLCLQRDLFQWVILNMCSLNILMSLLSPSLVDFIFHGTGSKTQEWCGPRQIIIAQKNRKHRLRNSMPDSAINSQDGAKR